MLLTLFCLWLGRQANQARQQRRAVEQLSKIGATVVYRIGAKVVFDRGEELWVPRRIRDYVGDDFFLTVVEVRLGDYRVGRQSLPLPPAHLKQAVETMQGLPQLEGITFHHTRIRDDDLQWLAPLAPQIEKLYFNEFYEGLSGDGIRHLAGWPRLRMLTLHSNNLDKACLKHLVHLPVLEDFGYSGDSLDAEAFTAIAACDLLSQLSLYQCSFDGDAMAPLKLAPRLQSIFLHNICWESDSNTGSYKFYPANTKGPAPCPLRDSQSDGDFRAWLQRTLPNVKVSDMQSS